MAPLVVTARQVKRIAAQSALAGPFIAGQSDGADNPSGTHPQHTERIRSMKKSRCVALAACAAPLLFAVPAAHAQHGPWRSGWGQPEWDRPGWNGPGRRLSSDRRTQDAREGRVEVSRFVLADLPGDALGHGPVTVESEGGEGPWIEPQQRAAYEAAAVDALIAAGYDTQHVTTGRPQVARLRISRQVLIPAEEKRNPVSGSAAMSVGSHGSAYGLAVAVDLTKPLPALVSTRLEARILSPDDGRVLWEGHASIATREGSPDWSEDRIAGKLAAALFDRFPDAETMVPVPDSMVHIAPMQATDIPGNPG